MFVERGCRYILNVLDKFYQLFHDKYLKFLLFPPKLCHPLISIPNIITIIIIYAYQTLSTC